MPAQSNRKPGADHADKDGVDNPGEDDKKGDIDINSMSRLDAALHYAECGFLVFPAPPGAKKSYKSKKRSGGRNWGATRDQKQIRCDFETWPDANIGLPTGSESRFFVVEADTKEGHDVDGIASLRDLENKHGKLPATRMAVSPSGSLHYYFKNPSDRTIKNSASELALGVDVRGEGGMVLAPPSVKPGVGTYQWLNQLPIVDAPSWLLELVADRKSKSSNPFEDIGGGKSSRRSDDDLSLLLEQSRLKGKWHDSMRDAVASVIGRGWPDDAIRTMFGPYCDQGRNDPDLLKLINTGRNQWDIPDPEQQARANQTKKLIVSSAEFLTGFIPPDYLVDSILQRGFIYSFTGQTGAGKTAIALLIASHVALGRPLGEYEVERGPVLYFAGENPDDVRMRWIAMAEHHDFDIDKMPVHFLPGADKLSEIGKRVIEEVAKIGEVALVVVDTSAAYFEGDDENNNVQSGGHARRLRKLAANFPGRTCGLICTHPVKNATPDNLLPRGGGAFLNEMDGNLTCAKDDSLVTVHWQGKFRGPDFAPMPFSLRTVTTPGLNDSKGRPIPTVIANALSEQEQQEAEVVTRSDENAILAELKNGRLSTKELAEVLGWQTRSGKLNKSRVQRAADRLKRAKLIVADRDGFSLTAKGRREADAEAFNGA